VDVCGVCSFLCLGGFVIQSYPAINLCYIISVTGISKTRWPLGGKVPSKETFLERKNHDEKRQGVPWEDCRIGLLGCRHVLHNYRTTSRVFNRVERCRNSSMGCFVRCI